MMDSNSMWETDPESTARLIMLIQVAALGLGSSMCRSIPFGGFGNAPFRPKNTMEFAHSVLVALSGIPMISQKRSNVLRPRGSSVKGTSAPKSSKYPIGGMPKILRNRTESRREKKL